MPSAFRVFVACVRGYYYVSVYERIIRDKITIFVGPTGSVCESRPGRPARVAIGQIYRACAPINTIIRARARWRRSAADRTRKMFLLCCGPARCTFWFSAFALLRRRKTPTILSLFFVWVCVCVCVCVRLAVAVARECNYPPAMGTPAHYNIVGGVAGVRRGAAH